MKSGIALAVRAAMGTMPVHAAERHHGYDKLGCRWGFDLGQSSFGLDARAVARTATRYADTA